MTISPESATILAIFKSHGEIPLRVLKIYRFLTNIWLSQSTDSSYYGVWNTNKESYTIYRMVILLRTLSDL